MKKERCKEVIAAVVFIGVLVLFANAFENMASLDDSESEKMLSARIERAITDCYCVEGMYPPDFDYIKENYGIKPDENKYYIDYQAVGANIRPVVIIAKRGNLEAEGALG